MDTHDVTAIGRDPDAFEAFYREHLLTVERFVARRVGDAATAADLTADIFLAAIEHAATYRPERGTPAAWLIGIARHCLADEVRRRTRELRTVQRLQGRRLLDAQSQAHIEERIDAERESRRVYAAMAVMPERDRALLELVALDGLSVADAAAVLGMKPGTARVRLHRSRARLQEHLTTPAPSVTAVPAQEGHPS